MSTRMTSKTIAMIETNVRILVRLAPRTASTRKDGARRTIDPAKDLHAMTHDQSPASALHLYPRNFTTHTHSSNETASKFAAPRIRRNFGCDFPSGFKKRTHAIQSRTGGANTEKTLRIVSNHNPCMTTEYASKALGHHCLEHYGDEIKALCPICHTGNVAASTLNLTGYAVNQAQQEM